MGLGLAAQGGGLSVRILVFVYDLSSNALGRAFVMAQACPPSSRVEVWGPASTGAIWGPLARSSRFRFRTLPHGPWPPSRANMRDWVEQARDEADLVLACKPLMTSYGWARRLRDQASIPLILDVDDWELGFKLAGGVRWRILADGLLHVADPLSYFPTKKLEGLAKREAHVTVSNQTLLGMFGGTIIPHARDEHWIDPARLDSREAKRGFGLTGHRVVLFFGTPRPHKGVEDLVDAVRGIPDPDVILVIAGAGHENAYVRGLEARAPGRVWLLGEEPFERIPNVLAAADVVAIPQRSGTGTHGQLPAKLIDAMAMARPIVATRVDRIPDALGPNAGRLVPPGDVAALRAAIQAHLADPDQGAAMGRQARRRFLEEHSLRVARARLAPVLQAAINGRA